MFCGLVFAYGYIGGLVYGSIKVTMRGPCPFGTIGSAGSSRGLYGRQFTMFVLAGANYILDGSVRFFSSALDGAFHLFCGVFSVSTTRSSSSRQSYAMKAAIIAALNGFRVDNMKKD